MGRYFKPLTEQQIINIARNKPFSVRTDGFGSRSLNAEHRRICESLCAKGVLRFNSAGYTGINYVFVSLPGCPVSARDYQLRKAGMKGTRFSKQRVLEILERRGRVVCQRKPKTKKQQSLADQCRNLFLAGTLVIEKSAGASIVYKAA